MSTKPIPIETERKFLIKMPDAEALESIEGCVKSEITQRYLLSDDGLTERIRKRVYADKTVYTHTIKRRISPMSSEEDEAEICREEYKLLKKRADPKKHKIKKTRYAIPWQNHVAEIDVFTFWKKQAMMEIELKNECEIVDMPSFVEIIREVTGNRAYSNNSMSRSIPDED